jgi:hypothetical protein
MASHLISSHLISSHLISSHKTLGDETWIVFLVVGVVVILALLRIVLKKKWKTHSKEHEHLFTDNVDEPKS